MVTKIKELRTQRGMTQQQLADLVHVSSRTIISIEKGQYSPSLMLSYRMAKVFSVTVEVYLLPQEDIALLRAGLEADTLAEVKAILEDYQ